MYFIVYRPCALVKGGISGIVSEYVGDWDRAYFTFEDAKESLEKFPYHPCMDLKDMKTVTETSFHSYPFIHAACNVNMIMLFTNSLETPSIVIGVKMISVEMPDGNHRGPVGTSYFNVMKVSITEAGPQISPLNKDNESIGKERMLKQRQWLCSTKKRKVEEDEQGSTSPTYPPPA